MKQLLKYITVVALLGTPFYSHAQASTQTELTAPIINTTLDGLVLDAKTKSVLDGATIQIKGTTHKVSSDRDGKFSFSCIFAGSLHNRTTPARCCLGARINHGVPGWGLQEGRRASCAMHAEGGRLCRVGDVGQ